MVIAVWTKTSTSFTTTRASNRIAAHAVRANIVRVVDLRKATFLHPEPVRVCVVPTHTHDNVDAFTTMRSTPTMPHAR
jgi:hypothetical protein